MYWLPKHWLLSSQNAIAGFRQLKIDERDTKINDFVTHHGLYWFMQLILGLKNTTALFQRAMDAMLPSIKWQRAAVYLQGVVVFLNDAERHIYQVNRVWKRMRETKMTLKLK